MAFWLNLGQNLKVNAKKFSNVIAVKEKNRSFTYLELNKRVNQLAHSLLSFGLHKGKKIAVLLENCIEMVEVFLAAAKTGLLVVPINFRLNSKEIEYIVDNSDAKVFIVHDQFANKVDAIKPNLKNISPEKYIIVGQEKDGYTLYDDLIQNAAETEPDIKVTPTDKWILIYTSGTTGTPKGVLRSHESHIAYYLITAIDFGFKQHDICLNVMPLCHINSIFFSFTFIYIGATVYIHPAQSFRAEEILEVIEREKITFISLIPTHYNLILNVSQAARKFDRSSVKKLLCSSAPVRKQMKLAIMEFFPGVELYEAYGSTEAGIVTILRPEDQLKKLGSIGYEVLGTDFVKILDANGKEVNIGEVGELYSRGPMVFDEYYKMPEKTASAFTGEWFSAGDMAKQDSDGFYYLVDRKDNMIITGGEHVYPSEVEEVIGSYPDVFDVAVIGLPDPKWGEQVTAVVVPKRNALLDEKEMIAFCQDKIAGYKCPKQIIFIQPEDMPRTSTGKILHRILREKIEKPEYRSQESGN